MKIEVFDLLEFQIMAAARQMKSYYGFPGDHEPQPEEVRYAVYQMARRGVLKQEGADMVIQEPVSGYMNDIARARKLIIADRGGYVLPRQCIYYNEENDRYICLENSNTASGQVCLSGLKEEDLFAQMDDLNQLPANQQQESDFSEEDLLLYWERHIQAPFQALLNQGLYVETEELLNQELVHTVFADRDKKTGELNRRMIILDLPLECGQVIQEADGSVQLQPYDREAAAGLLKDWWRK